MLPQVSEVPLYPPSPTNVPKDFTRPTRRYRWHARLALLALVGFVGLYFFLCFWFARAVYRNCLLVLTLDENNVVRGVILGGLAGIMALFLLKAMFKVKRADRSDLREITADVEPELFRFLYRLADEARAPRPHRVFVSPRVNASVFYDLSLVNLLLPSKKNLEIGLGLVNVLTLSEFKAVLAHEFGHFAQRSMAVGRWIYVAQQITGHLVAGRDWMDEMLSVATRVDIRFAIVSWGLQVIVWSMRAVLDTAFTVVIVVDRALSREMEFQADLVAVSLTGSDALIHALHRLDAADDSLDQAFSVAGDEQAQGRRIPDLFALQTRFQERMEELLRDPRWAAPPPLPPDRRPEHRVFPEQMANVPRMWSTHPSNQDRERNAKQTYLDGVLDERSAWLLFADPSGIRREVTWRALRQVQTTEAQRESTEEEALSAVDRPFSRPVFREKYRGIYFGEPMVLEVSDPAELFVKQGFPEDEIRERLSSLYPEELTHQVKQLGLARRELATLEALNDGRITSADGVIRHRGEELRKQDLPALIARVKAERDALVGSLAKHERVCRTLHLQAARSIGHGWEAYLCQLSSLLHYAAHTQADVDDAYGYLKNVLSVVTASGGVSPWERSDLVSAAGELYAALWYADSQRNHVGLPAAVAKRLDIENWNALLEPQFCLNQPSDSNIGSWMQVIDSWYRSYSAPLDALGDEVLEELLESEERVAKWFLEETEPEPAPEPAGVPVQYVRRPAGTERPRQRRLGKLDRFLTADGFWPALGRFAVAGSIVGSVAGFSGIGASSKVYVYNGLGCPVEVDVGEQHLQLAPGAHRALRLEPTRTLWLRASARGESLDELTVDASAYGAEYVYNVASAAPLYEWTAAYGNASEEEPTYIGTNRWLRAASDHVLEEPPKSVSTKSGGAKRDVLSVPELHDVASYSRVTTSREEMLQIAELRARFEPSDSPSLYAWMNLLADSAKAEAIIHDRLRRAPTEVETLRVQQDHAKQHGKGQAVCREHAKLPERYPEDSNMLYIAVRCRPDGPEQDAAFLAAHARYPKNLWLENAAGWALLSERQYAKAAPMFLDVKASAAPFRGSAELTLARIGRVAPMVDTGNVDPTKESPQVAALRQLESGEGLSADEFSYHNLNQGDLVVAVSRAEGQPEKLNRLLRLVAVSHRTLPDLVSRALALTPEQGLDSDTVWPALALAALHGNDLEPYRATAKRSIGPAADKVIGLLEGAGAKLRDPATFNAEIEGMSMDAQAAAHVLACSYLGDAAPLKWRQFVMQWFFAPERPYFSVE